ncbi:hypothetical protein DFH07DRAFT_14144 [Mycena maculata]|uniref:Uncharacterized protein n=1 Tax=Mycena maculata TaxID=230809 RepID=A0AAD7IM37_9AGAR|nr:hypothetical protein DFH07DRAFT_14144 [Mycena maculata]
MIARTPLPSTRMPSQSSFPSVLLIFSWCFYCIYSFSPGQGTWEVQTREDDTEHTGSHAVDLPPDVPMTLSLRYHITDATHSPSPNAAGLSCGSSPIISDIGHIAVPPASDEKTVLLPDHIVQQ